MDELSVLSVLGVSALRSTGTCRYSIGLSRQQGKGRGRRESVSSRRAASLKVLQNGESSVL